MKAVKGYTKHDYIMICKEEGGEVFSFASIDEAAGYFSMFGHELPTDVALDRILNDTNCDWIVFDDGSVIFKYYGRGYDESIINEMIEKEMAEKKAAYQSGEAYRRGSEDIIDVDYVEKEEK